MTNEMTNMIIVAAQLVVFGPIIVTSLFLIRDGYRSIKEQIHEKK